MSVKYNKEFRTLVEQEQEVNDQILDLELRLAQLQQSKRKIEKDINSLEEKIIETLL